MTSEAQPGQEQRMEIDDARLLEMADAIRKRPPEKITAAESFIPGMVDRLILYREALEVLLLVKDAVDYRGDACHPAEMVGAVLDKCILERIDAVLSRSGG